MLHFSLSWLQCWLKPAQLTSKLCLPRRTTSMCKWWSFFTNEPTTHIMHLNIIIFVTYHMWGIKTLSLVPERLTFTFCSCEYLGSRACFTGHNFKPTLWILTLTLAMLNPYNSMSTHGHFIRYKFAGLDWTSFRTTLILCAIDSTMCWKPPAEILVLINVIKSHSSCRLHLAAHPWCESPVLPRLKGVLLDWGQSVLRKGSSHHYTTTTMMTLPS